MHVRRIEGVTELKPMLLKRENLQLLVVEIAEELIAVASETALMKITPYRSHEMDEPDIGKTVGEYHLQVFIDAEEGYGVRIGKHIKFYAVHLSFGKGVTVEFFRLTFNEALHRHQ
jgi:hypothetical protein